MQRIKWLDSARREKGRKKILKLLHNCKYDFKMKSRPKTSRDKTI